MKLENMYTCDLCGKLIVSRPEVSSTLTSKIRGFFGTRFFFKKNLVGKMKHADICDQCQQTLEKAVANQSKWTMTFNSETPK